MTLITYPLDDTDFLADDAALFHCTRTTGVYSGDDFSASVSGADNTITIKPGIAWMRVNRFKGLVAGMKQEAALDMGLPDSALPRIDRIVLQYDANKNDIQLIAKKGSPASNPLPPERVMTDALYEIHLYEVRREPGAVSITAMNIKDLRLDKDCCGLMADSVTKVDTAAINAQINSFLETSQAEFTEWFESIKDLLDENTATKLQDEITALENNVEENWGKTVPTTRKVNNKALTADITLTADDVGAVSKDSNGRVTPAQAASLGEWRTAPGSFTLTLSDAGRFIYFGGTSTITIPTNEAVPFPDDVEIEFCQYGSGTITFAPASGVTLQSLDGKRTIAGPYGCVVLKHVEPNIWILAGALK